MVAPPVPLVQQMGEVINLVKHMVKLRNMVRKNLPAIWTRVKHTEALIKNTNSIMSVSRVVIGIIALALGKARLKI